jgi:hypothetical protein
MKFALTQFPESYTLPGTPSGGLPASIEAHKQARFLLGDDLGLFERAMNLQLGIVAENRKARSAAAGAILSLWSRAFTLLADTCTLLCSGSYASCPPLLRTALDCNAAQRSMANGGFADYEDWAAGAVSQARDRQALAFDLGRYRAASVLAEDETLGSAYRLLTDLSMPHFGSTTLQVAPETGLERMALGFADTAFHLGWAELTTGWLLLLTATELETIGGQEVLAVTQEQRESIAALSAGIASSLGNSRRCRVEEIEGRFLIHNFRRTASGQPKRVML